MNNLALVYTTVSSYQDAKMIAEVLLKEKLIACVNIFHNVTSLYLWQGEVCNQNEVVMVLKSLSTLVNDMIVKIKNIHPYDIPAIITIPIDKVNDDFYTWICRCLKE